MSKPKTGFIGPGAILVLIIAVAFVLALTGRKSVHAELVIAASPEEIWRVITDTASYSEWNPILVEANGEFVEGGSVSYMMKIGDGDPTAVAPETTKIVPMSEINQFGGNDLVLSYRHTWKLELVKSGTRVIQHEEYRGIGVWFWNPAQVEALYQQGLEAIAARLAN